MRKGLSMARAVGSRQVTRECAEILEQMKQLSEAAGLYESAQYYDKVQHTHSIVSLVITVCCDEVKLSNSFPRLLTFT